MIPSELRLGFITFGCKVNQYESAFMAESAANAGFALAPAGIADILVVNSCTVTGRTDAQVRQAVRQAARREPRPRIFVTGCYAQRSPQELATLAGVQGVFGNLEKTCWLDLAFPGSPRTEQFIQLSDLASRREFAPMPLGTIRGHTRAMVKIQDGCNQFCSYCIVPLVRGRERSLHAAEVLEQIETLAAGGYREIVLTGINLARYGRTLDGVESLLTLVRRLRERSWSLRVRLSSLEPQDLSPELLRELAAWPEFCPHFHLPLQSGAAGVLKAMHRPYDPAWFAGLVHQIREWFPAAALGLDVMVGFPTETAADFDQTRELLTRLPVTYFHVFPYSPRPGTVADSLVPVAAGRQVQGRAQELRRLGEEKKRAFYDRHVGQVVQVLVEGEVPGHPGWVRGWTPNYLRVHLPGSGEWANRVVPVRLQEVRGQILLGLPLE